MSQHSQQPPPPPPPHGDNPKTTNGGGDGNGLGPGNYDIFVIPQRDKGGGFIYLPAMTTNGPSFAAGFASALILVVLVQSMAPAFQAWWMNLQGMGGMGMVLLLVAVAIGAWAWGKSQNEGFSAAAGGSGSASGSGSGSGPGASYGGTSNAGATPPPPPPHNDTPPNTNSGNERPKPSWQQQRPPPNGNTRAEAPKNAWEKAREETRRKEEERRAKEEEEKRKAEAARRLREFREKEARERERREREAKEKEELKQKLEKEKAVQAEAEERKKREAATTAEAAARTARQGSTYSFSGVGEKTDLFPRKAPPVVHHSASSCSASSSFSSPSPHHQTPPKSSPSPTKPARSTASASPQQGQPQQQARRPPAPTARTHLSADDDAYSFRPYDTPKAPPHRKAPSSVGSESSWAPSATTARTTPPPSVRGAYSTKDPDKIMVKAVYLFMNQFSKTPASNLLANAGTVTDGLILRITTEGLFIDDDVRGVPQREWDVKAWTLKTVEVWCPPHCLALASASSASSPSSSSSPFFSFSGGSGGGGGGHQPSSFLHRMAASQRARAAGVDRSSAGAPRPLTGEDADAFLLDMRRACDGCCRLGLCESKLKDALAKSAAGGSSGGSHGNGDDDNEQKNLNANASSSSSSPAGQTGAWKARGLHVVRATVRDQEGKRYLFVLDEEESWKVAVGLQRLRKGTQVRSLGVSGMTAGDARTTIEMLGWV